MKTTASIILFLLVANILAGCQPVPPAAIKAELSPTGPPLLEKFTEAGEECFVHVVLLSKIDGNLQGTLDADYRVVIQHPCGPYPPGTYEESLPMTGKFKGKLDGREGTFDIFSSGKSVDGQYTANWAIVPGSGTGGLTGITGLIGVKGKMLGGTGEYSLAGTYALPPASQ